MRTLLVLLLAFAGMVTRARADVGIAYYASSKFTFEQCSHALMGFRGLRYPVFGHLWGTFGNNKACLRRFISKMERRQRWYQVRIYFENDTCYRAGRVCASDELGFGYTISSFNRALEARNPKLLARLRARAERVSAFLAPYDGSPWLDVVIVQALEDNFTREAAAVQLETIKEVFPYAIYRNPVMGSSFGRADGIELHDKEARCPTRDPGQCVYNSDGYDIDFGGRERPLDGALSVPGLRTLLIGKQGDFGSILAWWNTQGIVRGKHVPPRRGVPVVARRSVVLVNRLLKEIEGYGFTNSESNPLDL